MAKDSTNFYKVTSSVDFVNHRPLLHPIRSASELVAACFKEDHKEIDLLEWSPELTKLIFKRRSKESKPSTLPIVPKASFSTNNILKTAEAYHELAGHVKPLTENAFSLGKCLSFNAALAALAFKFNHHLFWNAARIIAYSYKEELSHELVADGLEIDILQPYKSHKILGNSIKKRISFLENLSKERDWFCECAYAESPQELTHMHVFCTHRRSRFLADYFQKITSLSNEEISNISHSFGISSKITRTEYDKEYSELSTFPDPNLLMIAENLRKTPNIDRVELINKIKHSLDKVFSENPNAFPFTPFNENVEAASKVYYIDSQYDWFNKSMASSADYSKENFSPFLKVFENPLRKMVIHSFLTVTPNQCTLFVPLEILDSIQGSETVKNKFLDVLVKLKILGVYAYGNMCKIFNQSYLTCKCRNNTQCMFREKLQDKAINVDPKSFDSVFNDLSNDSNMIFILTKLRESLEGLI